MGRESQYEVLNYLWLCSFFGVNLISKFPLFPPPLFLSLLSLWSLKRKGEKKKVFLREKPFMLWEIVFQSWFQFLFGIWSWRHHQPPCTCTGERGSAGWGLGSSQGWDPCTAPLSISTWAALLALHIPSFPSDLLNPVPTAPICILAFHLLCQSLLLE